MRILLAVAAVWTGLSAAAAEQAPWAVILERVDAPASGFVWAAGGADGATSGTNRYPVRVELAVSAVRDGRRTSVGRVRNDSRDWRVKRLFVRPFSRKLGDDFRALYYPAGLGARYPRLPGVGAPAVTNGWARAGRKDGENRYLLNCEYYIHPDSYPNWATSMAYLAFDFADRGVYWGCHDPACTTKRTQALYEPETRELTFEVGYEVMLDPGKEWTIPEMVEVAYRGDWHVGARVYREWLTSVQPPPVRTPRGMTGQLLCILKQQNGQICWPYGDFGRLADVAQAHGLDWVGLFGWTAGGHDHLYPDYDPDPEMGGREGLVRGIKTLHARGVRCYLYANGQLMEREATAFWRDVGHKIAIVADDGSQYAEHWNKFRNQPKHTFSLACPLTEAWYRHLRSLARQAESFGADGILFDQLGNADPKPCYAKGHGHAPGAMVFAADKETLMRRLKADMAKVNPDFMFMTEGIGDIFRDTYSFYHGMSTGAHTYWSTENVVNRFAGRANSGADIYPELFQYTFPDVVSTCRMPSPFLTRTCVNYCAVYALRFDIEVRFRPDRRYVESGEFPGDAAYSEILGPPELKMMKGIDQRTAQGYMRCVSDFRRKWQDYLLLGTFMDTVDVEDAVATQGSVVAKRFEARDGSSAVLVWNPFDRPVVPRFARPDRIAESHSPEAGCVPVATPVPSNSLRLYVLKKGK